MVNQRLLFKFGLKKEVLEVMNIDVMILESDHCREQTMGVIKNFVFVSNGLDCVFLNSYSCFRVRLSSLETWHVFSKYFQLSLYLLDFSCFLQKL